MKKMSQVVNYDIQKNTFYKVDRQTGEEELTYKNGEALKKFQPDITGIHYLIRRSKQNSINSQSPPPLQTKRSYFSTQRSYHQQSYSKTIDLGRRDSKMSQPTSGYHTTIVKTPRRQLKYIDAGVKMKSFMSAYQQDPEITKQKSSQKLNKQMFNQTLSSYTKLIKERSNQNKSPKKDQIPGCQKAKDPLQTLCTTISHFNMKQPKWEQSQRANHKKTKTGEVIFRQFSKKERASKQKSLFLQFHPEFQPKENPKGMQIQVQRKKNLKILQELFIRQNNKITKKTYDSMIS